MADNEKADPRTSPAAFSEFAFPGLYPYQVRMIEWLMGRDPDEIVILNPRVGHPAVRAPRPLQLDGSKGNE